jgi:hypothetical protein
LWSGVSGILNGTTLPPLPTRRQGTATRDPHHGDPARRYPVVVTSGSYSANPADATRQARNAIRAFARRYSGNYTWNPAGSDCHEFVAEALEHAGLAPGPRRL